MQKTIKKLIYLTTIIVTISSIYAGYQYLFEGVRRAYGFSRFSITQGNIAVMGAGVCLPFLFRKNNKIWQYIVYAGAFFINTSAILFSLTRGSYLAWIVIVLIFTLIKYPKALPILLIAFILTFSFVPTNIQNRFFSSFDPNESSFKTRVAMWQTSVDIMRERPLLGIGLDNFPGLMNIEEDGDSFKENALKKARVSAKETNLLTLADDSGLEVDYLDGKPGIYSARFSGENATDEENNKKLLEKLEGVGEEKRTARFRCVMAIYDPSNDYYKTADGSCEGRILNSPRGEHGFGYDPLFYVEDKGKTMAELVPEIKNKISHRANALEKMKKIIKEEFCS